MIHRNSEQLALDEVVFAYKNQVYGAYQLRQTYNYNLLRSVAIMLALVASLGGGFSFFKHFKIGSNLQNKTHQLPDNEVIIDLTTIKPITPKVPQPKANIPLPLPVAQAPIIAANNTNYKPVDTPITPILDNIPAKTELPITQSQTNIGEQLLADAGENLPTNAPNSTYESATEVLLYAPVMPKFDNLAKYLSENTHFPAEMIAMGFSGKVYISFVIARNGNVTEVKIAKSSGHASLDEEALRVVSKMPNWTPGLSNGNPVAIRQLQCINFKLQD